MKSKLNFRTKYDKHSVSKSFRNAKSLTDQQFADMCSVDAIIKRYGVLPKPEVNPTFADVSDIGSYQECYERVRDMTDYFSSLPSDIRDRFSHSPQAFFAWLADPKNRADAIKIGIFTDDTPSTVEKLLNDIKENTTVTPPAGN